MHGGSEGWTIIVPVKGTVTAKSRFGPGDHRALARAMALDTVAAACVVAPVVVVTVEGNEFTQFGATVVSDPGGGLIPAIEAGLLRATGNTAVLLGDHPALRATELADALERAHEYPLAMVSDDDGTGTALVTARAGYAHRLAFGSDSRARHRANGYHEVRGEWPGLSRDVDHPEHLDGLSLGAHSSEFLAAGHLRG